MAVDDDGGFTSIACYEIVRAIWVRLLMSRSDSGANEFQSYMWLCQVVTLDTSLFTVIIILAKIYKQMAMFVCNCGTSHPLPSVSFDDSMGTWVMCGQGEELQRGRHCKQYARQQTSSPFLQSVIRLSRYYDAAHLGWQSAPIKRSSTGTWSELDGIAPFRHDPRPT
jgi:hypothetical protein